MHCIESILSKLSIDIAVGFRCNHTFSVMITTLLQYVKLNFLCSFLNMEFLLLSKTHLNFSYRRTKWKRLNEARYNLLSDGVDSRLLRKDSTYYAHPGVTIPSFQSKVGAGFIFGQVPRS